MNENDNQLSLTYFFFIGYMNIKMRNRCLTSSFGHNKAVWILYFVSLISIVLLGCQSHMLDEGENLYEQGKYEEALPYFERRAQSDDAEAQEKIGRIFGSLLYPHDIKKAMSWLIKSANQGNILAQYELGLLYRGDLNEDEPDEFVDNDKAIFWLEKVVSQTSDMKLTLLAISVLDAIYTSDRPNKKRDMYLLKKGAELNSAYLQFRYADQLLEDDNKTHLDEALYWLNKSADQFPRVVEPSNLILRTEAAYAILKLASMYEKGEGVKQDLQKSLEYYKKLLGQNAPEAEAGYARVLDLIKGAKN